MGRAEQERCSRALRAATDEKITKKLGELISEWEQA